MIQAILRNIPLDSYFDSLIQDCISVLTSISSVSLIFVNRSANKATHHLARSACFYADRLLYTSDLDLSICSVVENDC